MKLSRELWREVEPLLTTGLEMQPAARSAWLQALEATHPAAAPVVRRLLANHDRAERLRELETVPRLAGAPPWSSAHAPGARIGPFELLRPLGRGGMGEVWLARQADGRVEREVALKLPMLAQQGELWRERFRRERDILAKLEHPHIARLYDAGVTESGQPWLAMEYVAGESWTERVAALAIPARLALFRQVLAAVAHAHRHLVVHRDLKPANILVDAAGQVKLLDFGIAKLLDDAPGAAASGELTQLGRVMTLRYGAPEQADGGPVTTAADVYSLGVVLHEALTGLSPYRAVREGRALTDAMLAQEEPVVPSRLAVARRTAATLAGDLDAILLKAMRRDPAERYATVERFDEDIVAHLERRPVKARAGTWRYLAGRFAARHRVAIAMVGAVMLALAAGLVIAERERQRAQTHFASVRKLANTFIFDVHEQIKDLPGSLKARETLVKTALEYLDALSHESAGDPALMYELAAAYRRVGNILGEPGAANTGNLAGAIENFQKAKRLHLALAEPMGRDVEAVREHSHLSFALARAYVLTIDARWQEEIAHTVRLVEQLTALPGATLRDRYRLGNALAEQAHLTSLMVGQGPGPEQAAARAVALLEGLAAENPDDRRVQRVLGAVHLRAGGVLCGSAHTPASLRQAIVHFRKARALFVDLAAAFPDNQSMPANVLEADYYLAWALGMTGEFAESERLFESLRARAAALSAGDPDNAELVSDHARILGHSSYMALKAGDAPRALRLARESLAIHARVPEGARGGRDARRNLADAKGFTALALLASAQLPGAASAQRLAGLREARALLRETLAFIAAEKPAMPGSFNDADTKELQDALQACEDALARLGAG